MSNISDITIKPISRREFIQKLIRLGKMGLLGATGFSLLNRCTGSEPVLFDALDPPFICMSLCSSSSYGKTSYSSGTTTLVFSGYNPEAGFTGYNIWYGPQSDIESGHSSGDRTLVIDQSGSTILNANNKGDSSKLPSYATSNTVNITTFVELTINNTTTSGNVIYVTAYNTTDDIDSPLALDNYFAAP